MMDDHPKATPIWINDETEMLTCPHCGKQEELDGFDVMGADDGCVFCTDCHQEIDISGE